MTTALELCQQVADEIGLKALSTIEGTTSDSRQFLAIANRVGREIANSYNWQYLDEEGTFVLVQGQQTYPFPAGYSQTIPITMWNRTSRRPIVAPLTPKEWQYYQGWVFIQGLNLRARIQGNEFVFQQDIDTTEAGNEIFYEFRSENWAESASSVGKPAFTLNDDTTKHNEYLHTLGIKWQYKKAKGLPDWQFDRAEYRKQLHIEIAGDGGSRTVRLAGKRTPYLGANVPDGNYGF